MTRRIAAALFLLAAALPALAATVAERSPFLQGHWWDPARPGSGFDLFNVERQVMVIWYTYDQLGSPVWYTAQGDIDVMLTDGFPLLKHRWENGRRAQPTTVGTMRLNPRNAESVTIGWSVNGSTGTTLVQPFVTSGVRPEVDHTGSWFAPDNSGWGFTLTEQGDVLGGVLFTYDAAGAPTWYAGFGRDRGSVELFAFNGPCPVCTWRPSTSRAVGRLGFEFAAEWDMTVRSSLDVPMPQGVAVDGAQMKQLSRPASARPADTQLARFDSATSLKAFLDTGMMNLPPNSAGIDFSPAPAGAAYSPTNLIEAGVDEAGLVKTDGRFIYTYAYDKVSQRREPRIRIAEIGAAGASLTVHGTVPLASGAQTPVAVAGLYLMAGKLVSVTGAQPSSVGPTWFAPAAWVRGTTYIEALSTATPERPSSYWRAQIDGHHVATRRIGDRLYVVTRYVPFVEGFMYGSTMPQHVAANQALLASTPLSGLMPKLRVNGREPEELVFHGTVSAPPLGSRAPLASMILVTAIDLGTFTPHIADARAIIGTVEQFYASPASLYLATLRTEIRHPITATLLPEIAAQVTDIHQVRLAEGLPLVGSASIEGNLGNDPDQIAFRMSEHAGKLRVVSSSTTWWTSTRNRVTILEPSTVTQGLLRTVSVLPNAQRTESLGKPGEFVYATRFVGERLYAVTFRQTDPLYVVDLSNAADPRIAGALEVPGFSEYLHPIQGDLLLGFGKDATPDGLFQGLQVSLYDVSDAGKPRELQKVLLGKRGSESALLRHHHAFSTLTQPDGSVAIAIPTRIHDGIPQASGGNTTYYPWKQSGLARFELRGSGDSSRLTALPMLVTHDGASAATLTNSYWLDPAYDGGRSILLPGGAIYVGHGEVWRQDASGNTAGPF